MQWQKLLYLITAIAGVAFWRLGFIPFPQLVLALVTVVGLYVLMIVAEVIFEKIGKLLAWLLTFGGNL